MMEKSNERIDFAGDYARTLDSKNRIVMPPKLKECLDGEKFVLCCFPKENFLRVYRPDEWRDLTEKHLFIDDGVDRTDLQRYIFHNAENCTLDAQNRFMINPRFSKQTNINREVMLIGIGKRAEIWAKDEYEAKISSYEAEAMVVPF